MSVSSGVELSQLVNPPVRFDPVTETIPIKYIYGDSIPKPIDLLDNIDLEVESWVNGFNTVLKTINEDPSDSNLDLLDQFLFNHASWKDHLTLSWDFHQFHGLENIKQSIVSQVENFKITNFTLDKKETDHFKNGYKVDKLQSNDPLIECISVIINANNEFGKVIGLFRLVSTTAGLKAYTLYTRLDDIKGFEEGKRVLRPQGVNHGQHLNRTSWLDSINDRFKWGEEKQPTVLIVGGGQGGLNLASRLHAMGISHLIVEKNPKIGDNWRNRYKFLVLHDPVWYDHLAYMDFPEVWPIFTPKDKLASWFETYAESMELSYWTNKTVEHSVFDEKNNVWKVKISDNDTGKIVELFPRHLVMATGHSGEPNIPTFKNQDKFKGEIVHSSKYKNGKLFEGKNALVIGCCNSGHDISHDLYEQGAKTTILQRSTTCVVSSEFGLKVTNRGTYEEGGPRVELADLLAHSVPIKLQNLLQQQQYKTTIEGESELYDALTKAGFKLDAGFGATGLFGKYVRRGGGYYIDVGCSKLISEGKITMKQGVEIESFKEDGVIFSDGTEINDLSIVVLATGYSNMKDSSKRFVESEVVDKLKPVWGLDEEGEIKTMWRDSGQKAFWFMGGNLALSRYFSKLLALKIIAYEKDLLS
ncbi:hypothetical protein DFJ63DRAFT_323289 [Scheffersomyces coipomensis]|uniref:uncharacterized protein n=1 Tax=Scheffersomyces coipomensis TaxID=1788519 RepID=UPI00315D1707